MKKALELGMILTLFAAGSAWAEPVPTGNWGSEKQAVNLIVDAEGAAIHFGCSSVRIDHRLDTDSKGNFEVQGMQFTAMMSPRPSVGTPVSVSGQVKGDTMTLMVVNPKIRARYIQYVLKRGVRAAFPACL